MAKKVEFNKITAFDQLMKIVQVPPNAPISESIKALQNAQNYLETIYNDAFAEGFEKGCDAKKKIDEI